MKSYLHKLRLVVHAFLDDFLLLADSPEELKKVISEVLTLFKNLGFQINEKKSSTVPSQKVEYLGVMFLLDSLQLALPEAKVLKIASLSAQMARRRSASRRELEALLGLLSFAASLVPLGRLRLRPLVLWMNSNTRTETRDDLVSLLPQFSSSLEVWTNLTWLRTPVRMRLPTPTLEIMTDASEEGWGGAFLPHRISGVWPQEYQQHSINWLELQAIFHTLEYFKADLKGSPVLLMTDNTTAVACIKNQGTLKSTTLLDLSRKILEFCLEEEITPVAKHLPGYLNILADMESRLDPISTEWSLDMVVFTVVWSRLGPKDQKGVDILANRFNAKLRRFVSPFPDPWAIATNALSIPWGQWKAIFAFPPIALLDEVIARLNSYKGEGVLIAPLWPAAPWFPNLLKRAREHMSLPSSLTLSQETSRGRVFHPNPSIFQLHGWKL